MAAFQAVDSILYRAARDAQFSRERAGAGPAVQSEEGKQVLVAIIEFHQIY